MKKEPFQFKPEDFREALCIGEMSGLLERLASSANQLLLEQAPFTEATYKSELIEVTDKIRSLKTKLQDLVLILDDISKSLNEITDSPGAE